MPTTNVPIKATHKWISSRTTCAVIFCDQPPPELFPPAACYSAPFPWQVSPGPAKETLQYPACVRPLSSITEPRIHQRRDGDIYKLQRHRQLLCAAPLPAVESDLVIGTCLIMGYEVSWELKWTVEEDLSNMVLFSYLPPWSTRDHTDCYSTVQRMWGSSYHAF